MSVSVDAFNEMMQQFIDELVLTFPDIKTFKKYQSSFAVIKNSKSKMALKEFYSSIKDYSDKIMKKDESFFTDDASNIEFINDLNIQSIWNDSLKPQTKNAIWQYMQTLYILATTINAIPQETLNAIEDIAKTIDVSSIGSLIDVLGKNSSKI